MPKFFYSVIAALILFWGLLILMIIKISPGSYPAIFAFIITFFLAASFSLSLIFYKLLKKKNPDFNADNVLYRKALKYGMFVSFGISGILLLRAFKIMSLLNAGLFLLLYVGIYYQLNTKR